MVSRELEEGNKTMNPFSYSQASDTDSAITLVLRNRDASFIAGGTTLVDLMKLNVQSPSQLVDINSLPLAEIEWRSGFSVFEYGLGDVAHRVDCRFYENLLDVASEFSKFVLGSERIFRHDSSLDHSRSLEFS